MKELSSFNLNTKLKLKENEKEKLIHRSFKNIEDKKETEKKNSSKVFPNYKSLTNKNLIKIDLNEKSKLSRKESFEFESRREETKKTMTIYRKMEEHKRRGSFRLSIPSLQEYYVKHIGIILNNRNEESEKEIFNRRKLINTKNPKIDDMIFIFQNREYDTYEREIIINFLKNNEKLMSLLLKNNFSSVSMEELLNELAEKYEYTKKKPNEILFNFGDVGDRFYLLVEGEVILLLPELKEIKMTYENYLEYLKNLFKNSEIDILVKCLEANLQTYAMSLEDIEIACLLDAEQDPSNLNNELTSANINKINSSINTNTVDFRRGSKKLFTKTIKLNKPVIKNVVNEYGLGGFHNFISGKRLNLEFNYKNKMNYKNVDEYLESYNTIIKKNALSVFNPTHAKSNLHSLSYRKKEKLEIENSPNKKASFVNSGLKTNLAMIDELSKKYEEKLLQIYTFKPLKHLFSGDSFGI